MKKKRVMKKDSQKAAGEKGMNSLRYAGFVVPLVNAVREQQVMIEAKRAEIEALKTQLNK